LHILFPHLIINNVSTLYTPNNVSAVGGDAMIRFSKCLTYEYHVRNSMKLENNSSLNM
jgi:hypothetical protein